MVEKPTSAHETHEAHETHGVRETRGTDSHRAHGHAAHAAHGTSAGTAVLIDAVPVDMAQLPPKVRPCTMAAALDLIGERWSLLALRELGYGVHRFTRIAAFTGAPRDILADRLRKLEASGLVEKRLYSEHPPRHEYHLTQAGQELFPVTINLLTWGERWAADAPAVVFRHTCGRKVEIDLECRHCGEPVTRASLTPVRIAAPDR